MFSSPCRIAKTCFCIHCYIKSNVCAFHRGEKRCPAGMTQRSNIAAANLTGSAYWETLYSWDEVLLATGTDMSNYLLHLVVKDCCSQSTVPSLSSPAQPPKAGFWLYCMFAFKRHKIPLQHFCFCVHYNTWTADPDLISQLSCGELAVVDSCQLPSLQTAGFCHHSAYLFSVHQAMNTSIIFSACVVQKKESAVCHCYRDSHKTWWVLP